METKLELLSWKNREVNLENIKRYHEIKVMLYRTNNLIHTCLYVGIIVDIICKVVGFKADSVSIRCVDNVIVVRPVTHYEDRITVHRFTE